MAMNVICGFQKCNKNIINECQNYIFREGKF